MDNPLKEQHPNWYLATDYHWLEYAKKSEPLDTSDWNRLDDIHRRDMASWSRDLEDFGEF